MNRGKYAAPRRRRRRSTLKPLLVAMAVVLLIGCVAGGTLAWLTSTPSAVTNTFTTSDITITLTETPTRPNTEEHNYKMIPGWTITKDPKVTVKAGSEKCYVLVKVVESDNFDDFMTYSIITGENAWTELTGVTDTDKVKVYYRIVDASAANSDMEFPILKDNKVQVSENVTKEAMNALTESTYPTLTFQAAAIQYEMTNGKAFHAIDAYHAIDWNAAATTPGTAPDPAT